MSRSLDNTYNKAIANQYKAQARRDLAIKILKKCAECVAFISLIIVAVGTIMIIYPK